MNNTIATDSVEMLRKMMVWRDKLIKANTREDFLKIFEEFALIKGHKVVNVVDYGKCGIYWAINGEVVMETWSNSTEEANWFANVAHDFVENIHKRKIAIRMNEKMAEKRANKKMRDEENKKQNHMVNADSLMTSINNLRNRNSELINEVNKFKNEVKVANDEIASLKKMLEMATLKIAELEDENDELAIYKEMVEEETKIEE